MDVGKEKSRNGNQMAAENGNWKKEQSSRREENSEEVRVGRLEVRRENKGVTRVFLEAYCIFVFFFHYLLNLRLEIF